MVGETAIPSSGFAEDGGAATSGFGFENEIERSLRSAAELGEPALPGIDPGR